MMKRCEYKSPVCVWHRRSHCTYGISRGGVYRGSENMPFCHNLVAAGRCPRPYAPVVPPLHALVRKCGASTSADDGRDFTGREITAAEGNRRAAPGVEALCATLEMRAIGYSQSSTAFDHGKGTASHLRGLAEGLREAQCIIREDAKGDER